LTFRAQHYGKSNQPISLKRGVMIRPTNQNCLTFGGDPIPDTNFGSLFHFPHYSGIDDFRKHISISHTVTGRFSRNSPKWLSPVR